MATYNYTVTARSGNTAYLWTGHGLSNEPDPTITIRSGDTLRVTNNTGAHVMRIYNDPSVSSGSQVAAQSGTLLSYTPTAAGVFYYKCSSHASMAGSIIVSPATDDGSPESNGEVGPLNYTTSPVTVNQMRDKINEIITKGVGGGGVEVSETAPSGAKEGDLWFDPVNVVLYVWIAGSLNAWVDTGDGGGQTGGGGASVTVSDTAPTAPGDGDLWFDTSVMELYVYVAAESSWIQTNGGGGSSGSFSTGWVNQDKNGVAVNVNTRLDFDHNLGTTDFVVKVYQANDANGTDAREVSDYYYNANNEYGSRVHDITSTSLAIEFGAGGDYNLNLSPVGSDSTSSLAGNWIKVVCVAGGGGSGGSSEAGPRAYVAFNGDAANLSDSIYGSLNVTSITDNSTGNYTVNLNSTLTNGVVMANAYAAGGGPGVGGAPALDGVDVLNGGSFNGVKVQSANVNGYQDYGNVSVIVH